MGIRARVRGILSVECHRRRREARREEDVSHKFWDDTTGMTGGTGTGYISNVQDFFYLYFFLIVFFIDLSISIDLYLNLSIYSQKSQILEPSPGKREEIKSLSLS